MQRYRLNKILLDFWLHNYCYICVTKKGGVTISPRTGRPSVNPKRNDTRIRMTDDEVEKLTYCSKKLGKTKTEIIIDGINLVYNQIKGK